MRVVNTSAQLLLLENGARPSSSPMEGNGANGDGDSEAGAPLDELESNKARDAKDRERWAKLKKLRQVFHVKRGKVKGGGKEKEKEKEKEKDKSIGKENVVVVD